MKLIPPSIEELRTRAQARLHVNREGTKERELRAAATDARQRAENTDREYRRLLAERGTIEATAVRLAAQRDTERRQLGEALKGAALAGRDMSPADFTKRSLAIAVAEAGLSALGADRDALATKVRYQDTERAMALSASNHAGHVLSAWVHRNEVPDEPSWPDATAEPEAFMTGQVNA